MRSSQQAISGWKNKLQVAAAHGTPAGTLAEQHCGMAEPGSAAKVEAGCSFEAGTFHIKPSSGLQSLSSRNST
ncbi:hypothetical protein X747_24370 [Mesorhizobium sp. LNJC384A00]|nr:hypothetical protein X766_09360 [Mesorhizobium sp. LSJC255A00]ESX29458.1 hypothetical protein X765_13985 [Mesorhizobium sp. LSHC440B00]ESX37771.1 hypothetical protein X763_12950 [Mesorhizobium sp. LSHC432A00]ESX43268.1 hypothetical protein X764_07770 [Mesorhizobium sp. LSHC440A00]ESX78460.1 hypothetical protein X757_08575 [Mesorhizobium sp. LSHC414A00]ESY31634.1 hypothetical protein X749_08755 [Mesorhizobium sp. LNJC391B00]ESY39334.1 hypothetical protein X747_24370 [Mesorhizobium sp. LNJC3